MSSDLMDTAGEVADNNDSNESDIDSESIVQPPSKKNNKRKKVIISDSSSDSEFNQANEHNCDKTNSEERYHCKVKLVNMQFKIKELKLIIEGLKDTINNHTGKTNSSNLTISTENNKQVTETSEITASEVRQPKQ